MESLAYGVFAGVQLWLLCRWTYRMGRAMTSEKMVIVFKYLFPPAAIVLSMAIRSVNRYTDKLVEIYHFQMSMEPARGLWNRMISAIRSISILINWALETDWRSRMRWNAGRMAANCGQVILHSGFCRRIS